MMMRKLRGLAITVAAAMTVSGCVGSLLGGGKPDQLYRFGASSSAAPIAAAAAPQTRRTILLLPVRFAPEIEGDRLLAAQGQEMLYIKDARWVTSAPALFTQALRGGFKERAPDIAIAQPRDAQPADYGLQLRVDRFEARYDAGPQAAPTIHIKGMAALVDLKSRAPVGSYDLAASQVATANGTAAIVAAFDQATAVAVAATVDWASVMALPRRSDTVRPK